MGRPFCLGLGLAAAILASVSGIAAAGSSAVRADGVCPATSDPKWNVYDGTPAQAVACGLLVYPLASTTSLPDGGTASTYTLPTGTIGQNVPPAGFNPLTATPDELAVYGISPEPLASNPAAQAHWLDMVGHLKTWVSPTPFLVSVPQVTNTYGSGTYYNNHWSGYMDIEPSGYFHYAFAEFEQPVDNTSSCPSTAETTWSGVGGRTSNNFGQDGTFIGTKRGLSDYQAWVEVPAIQGLVPSSLFATPFENFEADTNYSGGQYNWFMENYYTGQAVHLYEPTSIYSGDSVEFIAERITSLTPYLTDFITFSFSYVAAAVQQYPVNHYSNDQTIITDTGKSSGTVMAKPGALENDGFAFQEYWDSCT